MHSLCSRDIRKSWQGILRMIITAGYVSVIYVQAIIEREIYFIKGVSKRNVVYAGGNAI